MIDSKEENSVAVENNVSRSNQLKNNDTLLISETIGKVILPYTTKEIEEILNNENTKYKDANEVIEKVFTRPFSNYKVQFASRYTETMKLAREREHFSLTDSIALATEMMLKRYLHPAVISACRTLEELDVYLDCLDKNELDDFKIFKIKYELHPMVIHSKRSKSGNHYEPESCFRK